MSRCTMLVHSYRLHIHAQINIYIHLHIHIHTKIHMHTHAHIHTYRYTHTHIYTHIPGKVMAFRITIFFSILPIQFSTYFCLLQVFFVFLTNTTIFMLIHIHIYRHVACESRNRHIPLHQVW